MPTSDVLGMLGQALRAMGIGIAGVFAVLAVFYGTIKLVMTVGSGQADED